MLERHDIVPDFVLPTPTGQPARFYGSAGGRLSVLAFVPEGAAGDALLDALAGVARDRGVAAYAIHTVPAPATHEWIESYVDREGALWRRCAAEAEACAFVVSPGLRVLAVLRDLAPAVWDATLREALDDAPADAPGHAPVLIVPHAFDDAFCDRLVRAWETGGHDATGVELSRAGQRTNAHDDALKRRRDHVVEDPELFAELTRGVSRRIVPEVLKAFSFRATRFEGFKIGCYTADDRGMFRPHRDNLSPATAHRRFALSLNLNDDYDGGALRFPEYGTATYRPGQGGAILFSGSLLHEALEVTRGRRFVLVSFLYSEHDKRRS